MHSTEVRAHLQVLALTPSDAARLFGVGLRTVRRWMQPQRSSTAAGDARPADLGAAEPGWADQNGAAPAANADAIPGPAEQALRAWLKLQRLGVHWRPDGLPLGHLDPAGAVARVRARSGSRAGPGARWDVDLQRYVASMGGHRVSFVWPARVAGPAASAASGAASAPIGWALQSYCSVAGAAGGPASAEALADLIDDACVSIARRLAGERGPPLPTMVLGEPALVGEAAAEVVELRDVSFCPIVVCRLSAAALAAFLELPAGADVAPAQLMGFARRHHAALADLAAELHARPRREGEASPAGLRVLDISSGDLGLVRGRPGPGGLGATGAPDAPSAAARVADGGRPARPAREARAVR